MSRYQLSTKPDKHMLHVSGGPFPKVLPMGLEKYNLKLIFGFDHAVGLFFLVLKCRDTTNVPSAVEECCVDQCSRFDRVSKSHLLEIIQYYASPEELKQYEKQIALLVLDLPF